MSISLRTRREPLLDEVSYLWNVKYSIDESIPGYIEARDAADTVPEGRGNMRWHLAREQLNLSILYYSGGESIEHVRRGFLRALDAIQAHLEGDFIVLGQFDLGEQTAYVEALWLLSIGRLLALGDEQIERIADFYAADETNDGADELFELILAKLGRKSFEAVGVIHEDPYQLLLDCVKAEPVDRPALMTRFLQRWYKGQKECDWWGSHIPRKGTTVLDTGFFGYWAFEAALVTFLWDIDDSSYRDLPHYPKDLADYAREHALRPTDGSPLRVAGGQLCPRTGVWFTPARTGSRRSFKQGEVMPVAGGLRRHDLAVGREPSLTTNALLTLQMGRSGIGCRQRA